MATLTEPQLELFGQPPANPIACGTGVALGETFSRSILVRSGIPGADYCVNPYAGCEHACLYCYAQFMRKFTGHDEPWGGFVDARVNAPERLAKDLRRARPGTVNIGSVTDAYQPAEASYKLTRRCLEVLRDHRMPVFMITKSPLVTRDIDVLKDFEDISVGLTLSTDDDAIRRIFEPAAPTIESRHRALAELKEAGVRTFVFVGPVLPQNPERLAAMIGPHADSVYISRMNYLDKTKHVYGRLGMRDWLDPKFTAGIVARLRGALAGASTEV